MKSLVLKDFPFTELTAAALILFFIIFIGVVAWVFRPGSTGTYHQIEKFPLD
jgi:cbb3-type cytochrome oxidase subunit 3